MIVVLLISLVTYLLMVVSTKYKLPISILGLSMMLIYGSISNSIPASLVFQNFPFEIVSLIIVLALFTKKLRVWAFLRTPLIFCLMFPRKTKQELLYY